jgi:hypothetical protein
MDNHVPLSRQRLESLSTDELTKLADTYGIDIPPGLERIFIIEELLEVSNTNKQEDAEDIEINPSYSESALLPKQYNISFVEVIIRDPLWVFVFWEVKGHDREIHENAENFNGYCLRVIPLDEDGTEMQSKEVPFSISVGADDSARYIGFAAPAAEQDKMHEGNSCYVIKLGVIRGGNEFAIASSAPFYMPKPGKNEEIANLACNPLIRLSGVQDLSITKNTDRLSRIKR